jgi:hypothetical protein
MDAIPCVSDNTVSNRILAKRFSQHAQHGPANTLGEPWVYTYDIDDVEDMMAKIKKAIDNPIEP